MAFSVEKLPKGLALDATTGRITGSLKRKGDYAVVLHAKNAQGEDRKNFRIVAGERVALTPPMGWNSWNCWSESVDQEKVLRAARAMAASGLINHGWTYINIDDTWQGERNATNHALQANEKFPDMKAMCDQIHQSGLKAGLYSTPWITSYAKYNGGSSDNPDGSWSNVLATDKYWRLGKYSFVTADADQWAAWGFDYLKYDWNPNDVPHVMAMSKALRASGRDIVFSLSNTAPPEHAADWAHWANCWRTTSDIRDEWNAGDIFWQYGVSEIGFSRDCWAPYAGPGHWNDPDMLVVGCVGWGPQLHFTHLTPDEQYSHISLWCLLSAPLLIGCDLERLDPFTLNLLGNDEVLALDQDALGKQAVRVATVGAVDVFEKDLTDGSKALGFFNRDSSAQTISFTKLLYLGFQGRQHVRDLWRQVNLPDVADLFKDELRMTIPAHGVQLYKLTAAE
jgi:alpha-galactosidase